MARKSVNKWIIWLIIWTTVTGVAWGLASTKKWKEVVKKTKNNMLDKLSWALDFMSDGLKQMRKDLWEKEDKNSQ